MAFRELKGASKRMKEMRRVEYCRVCGKVVPIMSPRRFYCSQACYKKRYETKILASIK